jgi:galactokinase
VNLIGDHTDYQDGFCLPMAIDRHVLIGFQARDDGLLRAHSRDFEGVVEFAVDGSIEPAAVEPAWGRTLAGIVRVLAKGGVAARGCDLEIGSTVPIGSGLSSSAAFEVASTLALADMAGVEISGNALAMSAREAGQLATGVPCGVMDQLASVHGQEGYALLLDCRALTVESVAIPASVAVVVVHSGVERILEDSAYAERAAACAAAAERIGVPSLRDAPLDQVADDPIARHVVSENERVIAFVDALRRRDIRRCGELMLESHASLRDDFKVSTPELDALVTLLADEGAYGTRLTGAGFGGCIVSLVDPDRAGAIANKLHGWVVHAADGARVIGQKEN